uniref:Uncharacterized protein n=1 Tax=Mycena chlorophos TaxID=658473 RepID=A0ABQ0KY72_MYCCL|nr:predicted protein [Mycena chlorophos]
MSASGDNKTKRKKRSFILSVFVFRVLKSMLASGKTVSWYGLTVGDFEPAMASAAVGANVNPSGKVRVVHAAAACDQSMRGPGCRACILNGLPHIRIPPDMQPREEMGLEPIVILFAESISSCECGELVVISSESLLSLTFF